MSKTLVVIDLQNDYFADGAYPLWNADATLGAIEGAIARARASDIPVILVQHVADPEEGPSPFFTEGTEGAALHPRIREAAPDAPVVVKHAADSFHGTDLGAHLHRLGTDELLVCGMMTQNCVTHTAISRAAEDYAVTVLPDCCTTVDEMLHLIALHALSTRVALVPSDAALA